MWLFLMRDKSEVFSIFKNFHVFVQTQFQTFIKVFRSDNGTKFHNSNFQSFLTEKGIHHQTSCVNTPRQNRMAKRKNRHLLEVARALLLGNNVSNIFWGGVVLTAAYLIDRMPSKEGVQMLFSVLKLFHSIPNYLFKGRMIMNG